MVLSRSVRDRTGRTLSLAPSVPQNRDIDGAPNLTGPSD
jgi:hypothetical protein